MQMSESINELAGALSKAQGAIENVSKDKQAYGYKYAELAQCLEAIKKPMSENGLSITQIPYSDDNKQHWLESCLSHSSGQYIKARIFIDIELLNSIKDKNGNDKLNAAQKLGALITYYRRYALASMLGLAQEDDDAECLTKRNGEPKQLVKPAPQIEVPMSQQLAQLCKANKIDAAAFAKFHGITRENEDSVRKGVLNFTKMKEQFVTEYQDAI